MSGLEQVKRAIVEALEAEGTAALAAFPPEWARRYSGPVIAVGLRTGESRGGAVGSYLGERVDPETQASQEVYGMRLELTLSMDIYAPPGEGAAGCDSALEGLHRAVLHGLPSGLRPVELRWDEMGWDQETEMFLRRGSLSCSAFFTASRSDDGLPLTDFILKGMVTK